MVKIVFNKNFVDFEAPVYMDEEKQREFVTGMKEIFGNKIIVENIIENKKIMGKRKGTSKKFNLRDMILLANDELKQEQIASKLEKTPFAIQMKRGPFLMQLMSWAKKKKFSKLDEKDVKEFLKEIGYAS